MKTSIAQFIILGIFILFIVVGVLVFARFSGNKDATSELAQIQVWGTLSESAMSAILDSIDAQKLGAVNVVYDEIPEENFEQTLIEALADGVGPDVVLLPNSLLLNNQKKFTVIGFDVISQRDFKDTFVESSESLLTSAGTFGLPVFVDPLVMYWNRDMLTAKNVSRPPTTWEEVLSLAEILTERRDDRTIVKSAVALGDYSNIDYSKDIILALTLQAGGRFVSRDNNDNVLNLLDAEIGVGMTSPFISAVTFFTQFSDPLKSVYSWNRSLPRSKQMFINGDLAFYFGHASEAVDIRNKNPNLNFDITTLPQPKNASNRVTSGTVYSFFILATSPYKQDAFTNISTLTSAPVANIISNIVGLPPARRDLLAVSPGSAFGDIFWRSALWTKSWLDPDPRETNIIFASGINDVVTGKLKATDAARLISRQVDELLR